MNAMQDDRTARLWTLAEPYVTDAGLELIELQLTREAGGQVLRVFIDRPVAASLETREGAAAVGHEDCERVSRDLSAALDVADAIAGAYTLEVSSPGLDRPLRREADFKRFGGAEARIRTGAPIDGRRNFSGTLGKVEGGVVEIICEGRPFAVPIASIVKANLVPDWDAEFRRSRQGSAHGRSAS